MKTYMIATHDGRFHADDVMAVAIFSSIVSINGEDYTVVRTRDKSTIDRCDIVMDVGGTYDPKRGRFDHHQKGGAGQRDSGIKLAAAGLVWKEYGLNLIRFRDKTLSEQQLRKVWEDVDNKLIALIDASDNGQGDRRDSPFSCIISGLNPSWPNDDAITFQNAFNLSVQFARTYLLAQINRAIGYIQAKARFQKVSHREGGLLIMDEYLPIDQEILIDQSILFTVTPQRTGSRAVVMTVPVEPRSFISRKPLPESWAGLTDQALAKATGVEDAVFCHNNRFIAVSESFEGAVKLAKLALL